jgi:hypothetical protein
MRLPCDIERIQKILLFLRDYFFTIMKRLNKYVTGSNKTMAINGAIVTENPRRTKISRPIALEKYWTT